MRRLFVALTLAAAAASAHAQSRVPTIDQLIELKRPGGVALSPDGTKVIFTVNETNWDDNAYETEIFLVDTKGGSTAAVDPREEVEQRAGVVARRQVDRVQFRSQRQAAALPHQSGGRRGAQLTDVEDGVGAFEWSPDGKLHRDDDDRREDRRAEGPRQEIRRVRGRGHRLSDDAPARDRGVPRRSPSRSKARRLTNGSFTVGSFDWSPDGKSIAFDHRIDPNAANGGTADISVVSVADGSVRTLVTQDGPDSNPEWSPDGTQIAFSERDEEPVVLLHEQPHRHRACGRRTDSIGHRSRSTSSRPDRLGPGRDLLPGLEKISSAGCTG